jgi:hypothetical protein
MAVAPPGSRSSVTNSDSLSAPASLLNKESYRSKCEKLTDVGGLSFQYVQDRLSGKFPLTRALQWAALLEL